MLRCTVIVNGDHCVQTFTLVTLTYGDFMSKHHAVKAWKDMETKLHFIHQHQMLVSGHCNTPATLFLGKNPQYPHWTETWK